MTRSRYIETILYEGAAEIADAAERGAFLDETCAGNPELRARLEKLLKQRESSDQFFVLPRTQSSGEESARPPSGVPNPVETIGTWIGRYRLIERMGAGGCGVVYLAEQQHPVQRKVALKIIRLGMDTEKVIARFGMERQSLALMDHPNIARVLDAGATVTGRPYFVMELVDGERVTDFCDKHHFGLRERLELFIQICLAIQHAHQKGVIHRDIKPSNVMVRFHDGVAVPKVIDFGIAKATAGPMEDDTAFTAMDQFVGTPAYMSPEQASGNGMDVDTRSDIYSLGVLLYELLTGCPPFDPGLFRNSGMEEIRHILREQDPPAPSVQAALHPSESRPWAAHLKGDLDWIVTKAMEKDRQHRYETANGLAMDVRRHLQNEPVTAGPPGRRYRLQKLVRRNKVTFVAGTLIAVALLAGFGTSTWLFFREKDARGEADAARAEEFRLRESAEFREMIAQAAVKITHGDLAAADALLARVPVEETPPSLEAANSFRAVAEWHAIAGRWDEAARRFASLAHAMARVDASDSDNVSRHLLPAAATVCHSGDRELYELFRRMVVERFSKTSNPVVAEQILKSALLLPADKNTLASLKPLALVIEQALDSKTGPLAKEQNLGAWSCFSLALMSYREDDFRRAGEWANRGLAVPHNNPARTALIRLVLAMMEQRSGRLENARAFLSMVEPEVAGRFSGRFDIRKTGGGDWYDWVNVRILLDEATRLIGR